MKEECALDAPQREALLQGAVATVPTLSAGGTGPWHDAVSATVSCTEGQGFFAGEAVRVEVSSDDGRSWSIPPNGEQSLLQRPGRRESDLRAAAVGLQVSVDLPNHDYLLRAFQMGKDGRWAGPSEVVRHRTAVVPVPRRFVAPGPTYEALRQGDSATYLARFDRMVGRLRRCSGVEVVEYETFPGLSAAALRRVHERLGYELDASITSFFQQSNGVRLKWGLRERSAGQSGSGDSAASILSSARMMGCCGPLWSRLSKLRGLGRRCKGGSGNGNGSSSGSGSGGGSGRRDAQAMAALAEAEERERGSALPEEWAVEPEEFEGCLVIPPLETILFKDWQDVIATDEMRGDCIEFAGETHDLFDWRSRLRPLDWYDAYFCFAWVLQPGEADPSVIMGNNYHASYHDSVQTNFASYIEFCIATCCSTSRKRSFFGKSLALNQFPRLLAPQALFLRHPEQGLSDLSSLVENGADTQLYAELEELHL